MEVFLHAESWIALATLTFLEIVLGIDNIIFISLVSGRLPEHRQPFARNLGLALALFVRIGMLLGISWIIGFQDALFTVTGFAVSGKDLIMFGGGAFLLAKSTSEIHGKIEGAHHEKTAMGKNSLSSVVMQIVTLDIVFSFDSILTAVGMTNQLILMITAVVISIVVMMFFSGAISRFVNKHLTLQVLALAFLILIGFMLIVEGLHIHVPKAYIYFAVAFSLAVELVNMRVRKGK
ncbi:MAG: TerC family protein [Flavobacteriales bacterium]|nr:TerC family protein [Flavobacteriales bacterium]MCB9448573.1 TerC family protein [Flavobacteriales bacterium]